MRKLLALAASLATVVLLALPASADGSGAMTFTQTLKGPFPPFSVPPTCGAPGGMISGSGNAVFHFTINKAGDVWFTSTQEADFVLVPTDPTLPSFAGHFAVWFGGSFNVANVVTHDIVNVQATATDGSGTTVTIHLVDHISVSASGQVTMFMNC